MEKAQYERSLQRQGQGHSPSPPSWRAFLIAAALLAAGLSILWRIVPPLYFTNDDVMHRLLIEGEAIPGQPGTGFLLNPHALLGWILVRVHQSFPGVMGWDLTLTAVLLWALAVIAAMAWNALGSTAIARATAIAAVLVPSIPLLFGLQFTISAILAGGAAVLLAAVELAAGGRPRRGVLAMAAGLLVAGLLVRPLGGAAGAAAGMLLCVPATLLSSEWRRRWRRLGAAAATVLVIVVTLRAADTAMYRLSPEWNAYASHHGRIVRLFDWGSAPSDADLTAIRAAAGWSPTEWSLLQGWWGIDSDLFGPDRVARAYATFNDQLVRRGGRAWLAGRLQTIAWPTLTELAQASASIAAVAVLLVIVTLTRRQAAATLLLAGVFVVFCLGVQIAFKELPFRVLAPLQVCLAAALVVTAGRLAAPRRGVAAMAALAVLLAVTGRTGWTSMMTARAEVLQAEAIDNQVAEMMQLSPSLLVMHADSFPAEYWWRPFHRPRTVLPVLQISLNSQSPAIQRFLRDSGRRPFLRAVCTDPSILVAGEEGRLVPVTAYWRDHWHETVEWTRVFDGTFRVWRCTRRD